MLKKIVGFTLAIIFALATLFFAAYQGGVIPYPFLWMCISIIGIFLGLKLAVSGEAGVMIKEQTLREKSEKEFIANAEKFWINLSECEIKTQIYFEEQEVIKSHKAQAADALYDDSRNVTQNKIVRAVLVFKFGEEDSIKYYSPIINKDEVSIRILIDKHKKGILYVDKKDKSKYIFKLPF